MARVQQGYISTKENSGKFCEGVLVYFDSATVHIEKLIQIHLLTHNSTSNHSMREKYLSAVYTFNAEQYKTAHEILNLAALESSENLVTKAYSFGAFRESRPEIRNYYKTDPQRPFCKVYIEPKLAMLNALQNKSL